MVNLHATGMNLSLKFTNRTVSFFDSETLDNASVPREYRLCRDEILDSTCFCLETAQGVCPYSSEHEKNLTE